MRSTRRSNRGRIHRRRRRRRLGGCFVVCLFLMAAIFIIPVATFTNFGRENLVPAFLEETVAGILPEAFQPENPPDELPQDEPDENETIPAWWELLDADDADETADNGNPNSQGNPNTTTTVNPPTQNILPGQEAFAVFPFYIVENAQAYTEFQAANPHFSAETVVWKVNAFLHLPFYEHIITNYDPNPLLVNPSHRLPYGFTPAYLVQVYEGNPDLLATPETAEAFRLMRQSAQAAGLDLAVVSAYRTAARQEVLFDRQGRVDGAVARPYHSEHQTGRALDLWGPGGLLDSGGGPPSPTGIWVRENAHNYGFIVRYTEENRHITSFINEPWHITYVSRGIAQYIVNNGLSSLEEFVARYPHWGLTN